MRANRGSVVNDKDDKDDDDDKFEEINPDLPDRAEPVDMATQTESTSSAVETTIGFVILSVLSGWLALSWIIGLAGLAGIEDQLSSNCITVTTEAGQSVVSCGPGFGMAWFALILELITVASLLIATRYNVWLDYKLLLSGFLLICTSVFMVSVDFILTIVSISISQPLRNSAQAAAAGFVMLLMGNYALFVLILPGPDTFINNFLHRKRWPKVSITLPSRKKRFNPEDGDPTTGN
eukprot:CFRG3187T1